MEFAKTSEGHEQRIVDLFTTTFTESEGVDEGVLIGRLVRRQMTETAPEDISVFVAEEQGELAGAVVFSRMTYSADPRTVWLLSPMAVATGRQGEGIGQALLRHALQDLREGGADVAVTYGDPAFYGKVGFVPVSERMVPAPQPLSQPGGWLALSLSAAVLTPLRGTGSCIAALNDPAFW